MQLATEETGKTNGVIVTALAWPSREGNPKASLLYFFFGTGRTGSGSWVSHGQGNTVITLKILSCGIL